MAPPSSTPPARRPPAPRWCGPGCRCSWCAARRTAAQPGRRRCRRCRWPAAPAPARAAGRPAAAPWRTARGATGRKRCTAPCAGRAAAAGSGTCGGGRAGWWSGAQRQGCRGRAGAASNVARSRGLMQSVLRQPAPQRNVTLQAQLRGTGSARAGTQPAAPRAHLTAAAYSQPSTDSRGRRSTRFTRSSTHTGSPYCCLHGARRRVAAQAASVCSREPANTIWTPPLTLLQAFPCPDGAHLSMSKCRRVAWYSGSKRCSTISGFSTLDSGCCAQCRGMEPRTWGWGQGQGHVRPPRGDGEVSQAHEPCWKRRGAQTLCQTSAEAASASEVPANVPAAPAAVGPSQRPWPAPHLHHRAEQRLAALPVHAPLHHLLHLHIVGAVARVGDASLQVARARKLRAGGAGGGREA